MQVVRPVEAHAVSTTRVSSSLTAQRLRRKFSRFCLCRSSSLLKLWITAFASDGPNCAFPALVRTAPGPASRAGGNCPRGHQARRGSAIVGDPPSELDERFKKCPWLFKKGNTTGAHRQKRSQVRLRMENLIQRLTDNGDVIVQFFCAVASGQPFKIRVVKELPMTKEQEAVAQGIATPEQKAAAKKQPAAAQRQQRQERPALSLSVPTVSCARIVD